MTKGEFIVNSVIDNKTLLQYLKKEIQDEPFCVWKRKLKTNDWSVWFYYENSKEYKNHYQNKLL